MFTESSITNRNRKNTFSLLHTIDSSATYSNTHVKKLCEENKRRPLQPGNFCDRLLPFIQGSYIMAHIAYTQQVVERDVVVQKSKVQLKNHAIQKAQAKAVEEFKFTLIEISFYDHEIYAGDKLIACITHDSDDFATQRWVVMINDVEIHRANTWAKCHDYIIWHYKQGTLPTQQQEEEIAATENKETMQVALTEKSEFELPDDSIYCNWVKLGEVNCTDGNWVVRVSPQHKLQVPFNKAFDVLWSLWMVEVSPPEDNQSTNINKSCEKLLDQPFDELISEEWERLRLYKPLPKSKKLAASMY